MEVDVDNETGIEVGLQGEEEGVVVMVPVVMVAVVVMSLSQCLAC